MTESQAAQHFGVDISSRTQLNELQRLEKSHGRKVHDWLAEGIPREAMGSPEKMRAFRKPNPTAITETTGTQPQQSVQRSTNAPIDSRFPTETDSPDSVSAVRSSTDRSSNGLIQRLGETDVHIQRMLPRRPHRPTAQSPTGQSTGESSTARNSPSERILTELDQLIHNGQVDEARRLRDGTLDELFSNLLGSGSRTALGGDPGLIAALQTHQRQDEQRQREIDHQRDVARQRALVVDRQDSDRRLHESMARDDMRQRLELDEAIAQDEMRRRLEWVRSQLHRFDTAGHERVRRLDSDELGDLQNDACEVYYSSQEDDHESSRQ